MLMTYPSLHTFVGSSVNEKEQTLAFSWVSNIQLISGAIITLISGFLSDLVNIRFPFALTGTFALAIFLFYWPKKEKYFGAR